MDINTIKELDVDSLILGYASVKTGTGYNCLWCDAHFGDAEDAAQHLSSEHSAIDRFSVLLHSSALGFTPNEQRALEMLFNGESACEIEQQTGLKETSIRGIRRRVFRKELEAKATLVFSELWRANAKQDPLRSYKKSVDAYPAIDDEGRIVGKERYSINQLHDLHNPIKHATAIILVAKMVNNKAHFLIVDKSEALHRHTAKRREKRLDIFGGHTLYSDIAAITASPDEVDLRGLPLTPAVYRKTAIRELKSELVVSKRDLDMEKLVELFESDFYGPIEPFGVNNERSFVFLFVLPNNITKNDIRCYDEYTDTLAETVRIQYMSEFMNMHDLMAASRSSMNDGLRRVIQRFEEPEMRARVENMVVEMDYRQEEKTKEKG